MALVCDDFVARFSVRDFWNLPYNVLHWSQNFTVFQKDGFCRHCFWLDGLVYSTNVLRVLLPRSVMAVLHTYGHRLFLQHFGIDRDIESLADTRVWRQLICSCHPDLRWVLLVTRLSLDVVRSRLKVPPYVSQMAILHWWSYDSRRRGNLLA